MIVAALTFARSHWRWFLIGALVIALAFAWHSRNSWKQEAADWKDATAAWRSAFNAQKSAYQAAQIAAKAKFEAQKLKEQKIYENAARNTLAMEQEAARLRAAAASYARLNRVRNQAGAVTGNAGGTDRAGAGGAAESGHSAGGDADVAVPRHDFDQLVENTIRLKQVHEWGNELLAGGLATKAGD